MVVSIATISLPRDMISSTVCAEAGDTSDAAAHKTSAPKSTLSVPHFDSVLIMFLPLLCAAPGDPIRLPHVT